MNGMIGSVTARPRGYDLLGRIVADARDLGSG